MPNIRSIDMTIIDDLFDMGSGYVLNFSDRTFAQFFAEELNVDIDDPVYAKNGTSKAKRLRCFLQTGDKATVARTLNALWEYREMLRQRAGREEKMTNAHGQLLAIVNRLTSGERKPSHQTKLRQLSIASYIRNWGPNCNASLNLSLRLEATPSGRF
jgi:hypothetical protein